MSRFPLIRLPVRRTCTASIGVICSARVSEPIKVVFTGAQQQSQHQQSPQPQQDQNGDEQAVEDDEEDQAA